MKSIWEKDACLRTKLSHIDEYDLYSFDVFDTVLFRTCSEPGDVFELTGLKLSEQLNGWEYSPATFMALRREAEQRARSRKPRGADCTLDEILSEMPFPAGIIKQVRQIEIDCEKQVLYLNENIYSLMCDCWAKGKKIVLVSDMYHCKEQILDFLANAGIDTDMISDCFMSSEYGSFKSNGELFDKMLEAYPGQDPARVLHIGDSLKADVEGAKKAGINAIHYNIVPREFGCFYDFEKSVYHIELGEIASIRKLAAATHPHAMDSDLAFFHALGAEIIGPVYALFAEWIIQYAIEHGIKVILPFMREGELFSNVITRVIEARKPCIVCAPLYVSRLPVFISGIFGDNYDERISQTILRGGRKLTVVFEELGLDISGSSFCNEAGYTLEDLKANGRIGDLERYLYSPEIRSTILSYSAGQRSLLHQYLVEMTGGQPALTVDIGMKGTTERYLHDISKREENFPLLEHALMMGSMASNVDNILNGIKISAWLGIAGENSSIISKIMYQILVIETVINATCGSTLRYEEKDGGVCPVLEPETVPDQQKRMIKACWDGVKTFQEYWMSLVSRKCELRESLIVRKADFLNVLLRLIEMPTKQEAELLGGLYYFDGFNAALPSRLSGIQPEAGLSDPEIKGFIADGLKNGCYWPQAAVAGKTPEYFNRLLLKSISDDPSFGIMLSILEEIKARRYETGIIFCASELGRKFQRLAGMLNVSLACFTDSDIRLHGTVVCGLTVCSLSDVPDKVDYFVIASYIYAKEIRTILQSKYTDPDRRPRIFDFGEQSKDRSAI